MRLYRLHPGWQVIARPLIVTAGEGQGWLRLCGVGLKWTDTRRRPLLFSERNGIVRVWRIGPFTFSWLR